LQSKGGAGGDDVRARQWRQTPRTPALPPSSSYLSTLHDLGHLAITSQAKNHAPNWYRTPIRGPALGRHMRKPGCNGAVCFCNSRDFCNENEATRVESKATSHPASSALLLLTLSSCYLLHGLGTTPHPGGKQE